MSSTSIITPGENIASAEDWKAGEGTMVQGEHVISTITGVVNFNQDEQTISIASDCKGAPEVKVGDTVIAEIAKIRESMLEARILHVEGDDGREPMPQHLYGQIHVTKMVDRYLHDASDGVRRRDIIRATVTDNKPVIRLDMRSGDDCGVLQAICPQLLS